MIFESFSPAVGISFNYQAYVGLSMKANNTESGLSGIAPYGFFRLNSLEASNFLCICQQCLTLDLSTNQRIIVEKCMEECQTVINNNSVKYWKDKYFKEVGELRSELLYMEGKLKKAQKKIIYLKRA